MGTGPSFERAELPTGLALWFGVLFSPRETLEAWGDELPLGPALAALVTLASLLSLLLSGPSLGAVLVGVPVVLAFLMLVWTSSASLGYLSGALGGARASLPGYMAAVAMTMLPWITLPAVVVVFGWGGGWRAIAALWLLGLLGWGARLSHLAMAVTLGLGDNRAVMVSLWSIVAVLATPGLYVALIVGLWTWMGLR